jgi:hypothetical protein
MRHDELVKPEFSIGDAVTYFPHDHAYEATVKNIRYKGAAALPDEVEYVLDVKADILDAGWIATCREIYESALYRRHNSITWN